MQINPLTSLDSYKLSHHKFTTEGTEYIYSNLTPRTAKYLPVLKEFYDNKAVFFGLQAFIKDVLIREWNENFFNRPKEEVIKKFKRRTDNYLGKDSVDMKMFEDLHDLGFLPIKIKALPEGARVNLKVPFLTIINTDPRFAWLTNFLETILSCEVWKPTTTATITYEIRKIINEFALKTTGTLEGTQFQMHGFEFRGMSGRHDAARSGAGLLLNSCGTDSIVAVDFLEEFYNADCEKELIAASVPASEHSVSSLGTSLMGELEFFRRAITEAYPTGIVSLVSDTYDFFRVVTEFAEDLKEDIINRKPNELGLAKVVFRPDSGNPLKIICGDPEAKEDSPQHKGAIGCLWDVFGGTVSEQGYKVLHKSCGLIYGDSLDAEMIYNILKTLEEKGFASSNLVFGVGSKTQTLLTRDCLGIAQKATWAQVDGIGFPLWKDPVTDDGMKKSAKGLLRVDKIGENYVLKDECSKEEEEGGELEVVFENGKLLRDQSLTDIRNRLHPTF